MKASSYNLIAMVIMASDWLYFLKHGIKIVMLTVVFLLYLLGVVENILLMNWFIIK